MRCPKCDGDMERVIFHEIEIDRCSLCRGLWFDMLEKEDLVAIEGSETIDIGNPSSGKRYNKLQHSKCPVCGVLMLPMIDKDQHHIHYESCPTCYGTFFDAGEFRDLKEFNVVERFIEMVRTLRQNF
ncbi:MAG: zf-TFIIB domain-containing protein [Proteobacteria bacterium]|jgi:Zn-finger nucleic acid-binding protein|nr:zf-TFIIB domain-containing protein [Pseudomonadota bacterium]MDA1299484.1 zf-TFIIB domain-containing protein [Pseudomonadota bacterium]